MDGFRSNYTYIASLFFLSIYLCFKRSTKVTLIPSLHYLQSLVDRHVRRPVKKKIK
jgi:hypothetical protein